MSDQPNPKNYYANTAYKPAKRAAWEEANSNRQRISGSCLTWYRRTQDNGTKDEYGYNNIYISKSWEDNRDKSKGDLKATYSSMKAYYDHMLIIPPNYKKSAIVFVVSMAIAKFSTFVPWWVFFLYCVVGLLLIPFVSTGFAEYFDALKYLFFYVFPISSFSFLIWKTLEWLSSRYPNIAFGAKSYPLWRLDRQSGLFTIYHPKKAWEKRLAAPFYEFDAYLESSPDTQGSPTYSLMLYHPETGLRQKLDAQFPPTNMPGELVAAWQFIQRYMDVSQPLPDVPALEIHRHKDPTTAAADQRKGRNPRYWRDMSEAEVEKIQEEKYQKNIRLR
ncbi:MULTISPECIES: hypothetical protein [unclassified Halomonas]|uniref:hypothetical protein n=1 Tax=unclassified Halomonas TaxID=2609666 RepID=UPI0005FCB34E|nr:MULTISPECIES: hypothetical protein [unclassified Halomonas]CEP35164.1 Putative uncharacterized protein [Halomonas sp. R57-5]